MAIIEKIIEIASGKILSILSSQIKESRDIKKDKIKPQITNLIQLASNWSEKIELYELSRGKDTQNFTIDLDLNLLPKKLGKSTPFNIVSSDSLFFTQRNILLLGDPGAGKTTTLKRLCTRILLENGKNSEGSETKIPIVIRLGKIEPRYFSIFPIISDMLGIEYVPLKDMNGNIINTAKLYIGKQPIEEVILTVLESLNAFLLLDGLDELDASLRSDFTEEISKIALSSKKLKIVTSTRSGEYYKQLEGFDVYEVAPLSDIQISTIVYKWIPDPQEFLTQLNKNPYKDTLNRPLSLIHLVISYLNRGYLADQPCLVYNRLTLLYLEEWDNKRGLNRKSKYSKFYPENKLDFLAAVAYTLIYKMGNSVLSFSTQSLLTVYESIHHKFKLPPKEATTVVREIESHTGLIIDVGNGFYEFSHLTFQEFLCANYIVRSPFTEDIFKYLRIKPAPVAIAIALSPDPNQWINQICLQAKSGDNLSRIPAEFSEFLRRLFLEKPNFQESGVTGFALLQIGVIFSKNLTITKFLLDLLDFSELKNSLKRALEAYIVEHGNSNEGRVKLTINRSPQIGDNLHAPLSGYLQKQILSD